MSYFATPYEKAELVHSCLQATVTPEGRAKIATHFLDISCANITTLDTSEYPDLFDDSTVIEIARLSPSLRIIRFNNCLVRDETLATIASLCPHIISIEMEGCEYLTDSGIIAFVKALPNLESIVLHVHHMNDEVVTVIAETCPQLHTLRSFVDADVTAETLVMVANNCPKLTSVNFYGSDITDDVIIAYANGCPNIVICDLSHCWDVTDESVRAIADSLIQLETIDLYDCDITEDAIVSLVNGCPKLTKIILKDAYLDESAVESVRKSYLSVTIEMIESK